MEDQAFKFLTIHAKDEWCHGSSQQEYQKNYSENDSHLQRLAWDVAICSPCISHYNKNLDRNYAIFFGIWNGGGDVVGSRNPFIKGVDGFRVIRGWMGQSEIWTVKPDRWKEDSHNLPSSTLPKKNGQDIWQEG